MGTPAASLRRRTPAGPSDRPSRREGRSAFRRAGIALLLPAILLLSPPARGAAQEADSRLLDSARQLRDAGAYDAAIRLIDAYLGRRPGEGEARWLLAQTLYWDGRTERAVEEYRRTLERLPDHAVLRLDFGRLLAENGRPDEAGEVLRPVIRGEASRGASPRVVADAHTWLGKLAYWEGELRTARDHLGTALRTAPGQAEARRLYREIQALRAPWLTLGAGYRHDSQPLDAGRGRLELGWRPSPPVRIELRERPAVLWAPDRGADPAVETEAALGLGRPDGPAGAELRAGRAERPSLDRGGWIGGGAFRLRFPGGVELEGEARRWQYRFTTSSLDTALFVESGEARLVREAPTGWAGEAGARLHSYPDGNRVLQAFAWFLAPVWSRGENAFRIGYAFEHADSDRSTFVPESAGSGGGVPGPSAPSARGIYDPYYTPEEVRQHHAVAALQVAPGAAATLSLDGSVGVVGRELAPVVDSAGELDFVRRDFLPWRIRSAASASLSPRSSVRVEGAYREGAFFRTLGATAEFTYRFLGPLPGSGR